jgi:proteasome accessory factor C
VSGFAGERLSRLLALVPWLVEHDGVTIADTAAHFGVDPEQLERDLWLLVVCGLPGYGPDQLVDIDFWDEGVIHVLDPQNLDRPLQITQDEALILLLALRMLAQLPGIEDRDAILSAAAKLEVRAAGVADFVAIDQPVAAVVTQAVDQALADDDDLALVYAGASRDEVSERQVHPMRLSAVDGVAYLSAYCRSAEAVRTFRLDRIVRATVVPRIDDAGEPDPDPGLPMVTTPVHQATLRLAPPARWVIDVHPGTVVIAEEPDGSAVVELPMHSPEWAARLVLSLAGQATAVAPPELVDEVAGRARAALAHYPGA